MKPVTILKEIVRRLKNHSMAIVCSVYYHYLW